MFVIEVLLVEYSVTSILPVLIASVTASVMIQSVYGYAPAFTVSPIMIDAIRELPLMIAIGMIAGMLGTLYCHLIVWSAIAKARKLSPPIKLLIASAITGLLAIPSPAIMGVGYDTMSLWRMAAICCWSARR